MPKLLLVADLGAEFQLEYVDALPETGGWMPLEAGIIASQPQFYHDGSAAGRAARFYRLVSSSAPSMLHAQAVPRVRLVAEVNQDYVLEYRLASGPSNSWAFLDTVSVTNVPQFYYDDTAVGQSARLYRLIPASSP